jgi:HlyD family secretion protein
MSRKVLFVLIAILIAAIATWRLWPKPVPVETIVVREAAATRVLAVNGRIRPRLSVDVQPRVAGDLVSLPFDVGDRVARGDLIARVDDGPQGEAVSQASAALAGQRNILEQARRDLARYEAIPQYVTRQRVEQARLAVRQAEDEVRRLSAGVAQARQLRDRNEVRAPFAGLILERPVDPGQAVNTNTILYRLADLADPQVTAQVDEIYAVALRPGQDARISVPGIAGAMKATIVHIEPRVDPETGARDVRLRIVDPLVTAPAGLTVTVNLIVERRDRAISVPRSAIAGDGMTAHVLAVDDKGKVAERQIRFIDWPAESVIVGAGLKAGERILADPSAVRPGQRVRVAG